MRLPMGDLQPRVERLNQFELAAFFGYYAELRQHDAHNFLEAEARIGHASQAEVRDDCARGPCSAMWSCRFRFRRAAP